MVAWSCLGWDALCEYGIRINIYIHSNDETVSTGNINGIDYEIWMQGLET